MSAPLFVTVAQVERLHGELIAAFGGTDGIRNRSLFESAVAQPRNVYHYAEGDLFDIAAAYAFPLAQAQAFLDGNKRVGIAAALVFLEGNGISVPANTDRLHDAMVAVAGRRMDRTGLAVLLRQTVGSKTA